MNRGGRSGRREEGGGGREELAEEGEGGKEAERGREAEWRRSHPGRFQ